MRDDELWWMIGKGPDFYYDFKIIEISSYECLLSVLQYGT